MKLIEFKEYDNLNGGKSLNKKKIIVLIIVSILIFISIIFSVIYMCNEHFRNWADVHVLMKTVSEGKLSSIDIEPDEDVSIFAYDKYVVILNDNKLNIYNTSGKKAETIDLNISNPAFTSNGKYLAVAEKGKQKLYLISGTKQKWSADIEGTISKVSVNENGYVSVICSGTTYKSVIIVFDQNGNQLIKSYIPNNSVIDSAISSDNKYLSFAEIDTSGTLVNSLIINLKYQGSKNLICMCNNGVYVLSDGNSQMLMDFGTDDSNYTFAGIDLINNIYSIEETSDGILNQSSEIKLINTGTKKNNSYSLNSIAKSTSSAGDNIAINLGTEIYFINTKGWLKKKYVAEEEIRNIIVSDRIAAIVFRDKVEILVL